jgi:Type I restriction enzyme R protein N terminus (HSDR_N)
MTDSNEKHTATPTQNLYLLDLPWIINTLFDDSFLNQKADELVGKVSVADLEHWLSKNFEPEKLKARNEAQLEEKFIAPLLAQLGWNKAYQVSITVQGKQAKPDYCLLEQAKDEQKLIDSKDNALITAICESKAWNKALDTGKANREKNPHHQLQDYLSTLRVRFGFLTNGRIWRMYDTDKITAKKSFIEIDLEKLLAETDAQQKAKGLALFAFFFERDTYAKPTVSNQPRIIEQIIIASSDFTLEVEENLKAVIYGYLGEESLFEIMGRAIQKANPKASLDSVYENSVILLFRLLFVVYFEDKNSALLSAHPFYEKHSLKNIFESLRDLTEKRAVLHDGIYALKQLFEMLDQGAEDIDVPLFNGGLFDPARAPLLLTPKIFDNAILKQLLEKLLFKTHRGTTLFESRRDFKNMSVTHLGRIYEGLLEFRFERASESAVYLEYESSSTKGKAIEAYYDDYDVANLRKEKGFRVLREHRVRKGDIYIKSASNSRKTSASYYTPASLSQP